MRARELKFRAWVKNEKRMVQWDEVLKETATSFFAGHLETVILMQATGVKDVNEKEIYEGDILKTTYIKSMGDAGKMNSCVIWNEFIGAWQISYTGAFGDPASDYLYKFQHEIIGNIAQNRDLLPIYRVPS